MRSWFLLALLFWSSMPAFGSDEIKIAPPEEWVTSASIPSPNPKYADEAYQALLIDRQDKFSKTRTDTFFETAHHIQNAEGLALSNVFIEWSPEFADLTVHKVNILRGEETIDLLAKGQRFDILRREPNLETAMLDGVLTATLQPEGLRVGDTINVAYTTSFHNPLLQGHAESGMYAIASEKISLLRVRQVWGADKDMRWRADGDLLKPKVKKTRNGSELVVTLRDAASPAIQPNAPPRYSLTPALELSDFSEWRDVAELLAPLYEEASKLAGDSSLKQEAARIAAAAPDVEMRAEMALKLVQEKIRYVFVGLDAGGYKPAKADDVWLRRYGDCKGKSVVLIALLRELGISAEPALVSTAFGDSLKDRLPMMGAFDHVIVRLMLDGEEYWLDGTRTGDVSIRNPSWANYHWALPLSADPSDLVPM